jgi:HAMP domain-containing protein
MRLTAKLLFTFLMTALIPVAALGYLSYGAAKQALQEQALDDLTVIAEAKEGHLYSFLEGIKGRAADFSSDGFIRDRTRAIESLDPEDPRYGAAVSALNKHLKLNKMPLDKSIHMIAVIGLNGRIIASTAEGDIGRDESDDDYFIHGKKGVYVSDVHISPHVAASQHPYHIAASAPLTGRETGAPLGVIVNFYDTHELDKILSGEFQVEKGALRAEPAHRETMEVYLVNRDGLMITESKFKEDTVLKQRVETLPVLECAAGREATGIYKNYLDTEVIGAAMCIPSMGWTLLTEMSTEEAFVHVAAIGRKTMILGGIIAGLVVFLAYFIATGITTPLIILTRTTRKFAQGDFDARVQVKTKDEIGELASSFNSMASELRSLYDGLERKVGEVEGLLELSELLRETVEPRVLYGDVTAHIAGLLDVEQCCIILYDSESMEFSAPSPAYGMSKKQLKALSFSLIDAAHTLEHWTGTESLVSNDPARDERLMGGLSEKFKERNLLLAKLLVAGEFLGVLRLANKRTGDFTSDDARLADIIASRLGAALHTMKLFKELQESEEKHRGLVETSLDAIVAADEKGMITAWNRAAESIFGYPAAEALGKG